MPENSNRPRKRPSRTNAMAASVPITVAAVADNKAMRSVTQADSSIAWSARSSTYHRVDQPPHTVTSREALKDDRLAGHRTITKNAVTTRLSTDTGMRTFHEKFSI